MAQASLEMTTSCSNSLKTGDVLNNKWVILEFIDPAYASSPVLRVTGYGASVFASFFDRRLPTEAEWLYATIKGASSPQLSSTSTPIRRFTLGLVINRKAGYECDISWDKRQHPRGQK